MVYVARLLALNLKYIPFLPKSDQIYVCTLFGASVDATVMDAVEQRFF